MITLFSNRWGQTLVKDCFMAMWNSSPMFQTQLVKFDAVLVKGTLQKSKPEGKEGCHGSCLLPHFMGCCRIGRGSNLEVGSGLAVKLCQANQAILRLWQILENTSSECFSWAFQQWNTGSGVHHPTDVSAGLLDLSCLVMCTKQTPQSERL